MSTLLANGTCRACGKAVHLAVLVGDGRRIRINLRPVSRGALAFDASGNARWIGLVEAKGELLYQPHAFTCKVRDKLIREGELDNQGSLLELAEVQQAREADGST